MPRLDLNPLSEILLPYQRDFVLCRDRQAAWVSTRQGGKSTAIGWAAALNAVDGEDSILISTGERAAIELIDKVKSASAVLCHALTIKDIQLDYKSKQTMVRFSNGAKVFSLPGSNPNAVRGYTGHIFADEVCFINDFEKMYAALVPIMANEFKGKYRLRLTSTPAGKNHKLYDIVSGEKEGWTVFETTIHQAVAQGLPMNISELMTAVGDADIWATEFECVWMEEMGQFLPFALIDGATTARATEETLFEASPGMRRFGGGDIGRHRDLSCSWLLREKTAADADWDGTRDVLITDEVLVMNKMNFAAQQKLFGERIKHCRRYAIDATGIGEETGERLQMRYGEAKVMACKITNEFKNQIFPGLKHKMQMGRVEIPNSPVIRADLAAIEKCVTPNGTVKYIAARTVDGHSDRANALALAVHASISDQRTFTKAKAEGVRTGRPVVRSKLVRF